MKIVTRTLIVASGFIAAFATSLVVDMTSPNGKAAMAETAKLISYKVIDRRESSSAKLTLTVEVPLVEGRLPYESELLYIANHLVGADTRYKRKFVSFYLPGMEQGKGAFATGQQNQDYPELRIFIRPDRLAQYPEYANFAYPL